MHLNPNFRESGLLQHQLRALLILLHLKMCYVLDFLLNALFLFEFKILNLFNKEITVYSREKILLEQISLFVCEVC